MTSTHITKKKKRLRPWCGGAYRPCDVCGVRCNTGRCYVLTRGGDLKELVFCYEHIPEAKGCVEDMSLPFLENKEANYSEYNRDRILPKKKKAQFKNPQWADSTPSIPDGNQVTAPKMVPHTLSSQEPNVTTDTKPRGKHAHNKKRKKSKSRVVEL
jgi:hypothetical protein